MILIALKINQIFYYTFSSKHNELKKEIISRLINHTKQVLTIKF